MKVLLILSFLVLTSCTGKSGSADVYKAENQNEFSAFINQKNMPSDPNLTIDKSIVNNDYPIEIALYKDQRFFYHLPNLGSGKGKWKFKDGKLELRASRKIFDMYIEVYGGDQDIKKLAIQFSDRFGFKSLNMDNNNIR